MKRQGLIKLAVGVQLCWALVWVVISAFFLYLTTLPSIRNGAEAAESILGLGMVAAVSLALSLIAGVSWFGLLKQQPWGWWMALVCNVSILLMLSYSMNDDGWDNIDPEMALITVLAVIPVLVLLLPAVVRFYRRDARLPVGGSELGASL